MISTAFLTAALVAWPVWLPRVVYGPGAAFRSDPAWSDGIRIDGPEAAEAPLAAARALRGFADDPEATDLLYLLGRTPRGIWSLEAHKGPGGLEARLALGGASGRRRTWLLAEGGSDEGRVVEALAGLAHEAGWDRTPIVPIEPAPLGDPPDLIVTTYDAALPPGAGWTLQARPVGGRTTTLARGGARFGTPTDRLEAAAFAARAYVAAGDWVWAIVKTRGRGGVTGRWEAVFIPRPHGR